MENDNKPKFLLVVITLIFINFISINANSLQKPSYDKKDTQIGFIPKKGFVPDDTTAIKIAEAVWLPIYGNIIYSKKPFKAVLKKGVWIVEGTLPRNYQGGVPYIEIQKKDGKILKVIHGK